MPGFTGGIYEDSKRIGDVLSAMEGPHETIFQFGQTAPIATRKRYTLNTTAKITIGLGASSRLFEVDSDNKTRIRVLIEKTEPLRDGTKIIVSVE